MAFNRYIFIKKSQSGYLGRGRGVADSVSLDEEEKNWSREIGMNLYPDFYSEDERRENNNRKRQQRTQRSNEQTLTSVPAKDSPKKMDIQGKDPKKTNTLDQQLETLILRYTDIIQEIDEVTKKRNRILTEK